MIHLRRRGRLRRPIASLTATAVGAAGLAALASAPAAHAVAPAGSSADTPAGTTLSWGVSQYLTEHLTGQTFTDGASVADGVVTFTGGTGRTDTGTHETSVQYHGSAHYGFVNAGAELYSVTFSDPEVTIDAQGHGAIAADVAWTAPGGANGSAPDLTVTTFDGGSATWTGYSVAATPAWAGVAPADAYGAGKPVNGESWAVGFVTALPSSVRATFYSSGSNPASDAKKPPTAFTAAVPGPALQVTGRTVSADEVSLDVAGTGFSAVTRPGDAGIYVGLAPSGGLPDVSSQSGTGRFAASTWVGGGIAGLPELTDGAFTATLTADTGKLVAGTSYSVYTWQAHGHSTTSQDTETPVDIDWSAVGATSLVPVVTAPALTYGRAGSVRVRLPGADGSVTLTGLGAARTATLSDGVATFPVPASTAPRSYRLSVAYSGEFRHFPSRGTATLTVRRATASATVSWVSRPRAGKRAALVVRATGPTGVAAPTGAVTVQVAKGRKKVALRARALGDGQVRFALTRKQTRKLGTGVWRVRATYAGSGVFDPATATTTVRARR